MVPSPSLAVALIALHAVAAACVLAVAASAWPLALALLALGAAAAWSRALLRSRQSPRALELAAAGLSLELANGERISAEPTQRRYVSRFLVTVPLRRPRRTILVTAGMMSVDDFRRLRIWALWGRLPGVAAAQLPA